MRVVLPTTGEVMIVYHTRPAQHTREHITPGPRLASALHQASTPGEYFTPGKHHTQRITPCEHSTLGEHSTPGSQQASTPHQLGGMSKAQLPPASGYAWTSLITFHLPAPAAAVLGP